jgi:hypothetical protein
MEGAICAQQSVKRSCILSISSSVLYPNVCEWEKKEKKVFFLSFVHLQIVITVEKRHKWYKLWNVLEAIGSEVKWWKMISTFSAPSSPPFLTIMKDKDHYRRKLNMLFIPHLFASSPLLLLLNIFSVTNDYQS